jgi:hypothetical protein
MRFIHYVVLFGKACIALPMIIIGLVYTLAMAVIALFAGRIWQWCVPQWWENPFTHIPWFWSWGLRYVFLPLLGIRVCVENTLRPFDSTERAVVAAVHGSTLGLLMEVWAMTAFLPHPVRWALKRELMRWPMGWGLAALGLAWPIDREDRQQAMARLATMGEGFNTGCAAILVDGHRPTQKRIEESREFYRGINRPDLADRLMYTSRPRPAGLRHLLLHTPHERLVRVAVTSSTHEEGLGGILSLMFGGTIFVSLEDWDWELRPEDEVYFTAMLTECWLGTIHDWIREKRRQAWNDSWWLRMRITLHRMRYGVGNDS